MKRQYPVLIIMMLLAMTLQARDVKGWVVQLEKGITNQDLQEQLSQDRDCAIHIRSMSQSPNIQVIHGDCISELDIQNIRGLIQYEREVKLELRSTTPNDRLYGDQWQMERIAAPEVWDISTGGITVRGDEIVVAVMDEQYSVMHPDLVDNLWTNNDEIPDDGIDNDNNGYIDDHMGFHFVDSTDTHTDGGSWHGTAVCGIIGAKGNNEIGVAGVNWDLKVMVLDPINPSSKVEEAMLYVYNMRKRYNESNGAEGAYIVAFNMSFGQTGLFADQDFPIMCSLIDSMGTQGILAVGSGPNQRINIDEEGDLPNDCRSDFLISVTNSNEQDDLVGNAGYGPINLDLTAPGDGTVSTKRDSSYLGFGGTSASAPYVSGAVALLYSAVCEDLIELSLTAPGAVAAQVRQAILLGVDLSPDLTGMTTTGGRLNIFNALEILKQESCSPDSTSGSNIAFITSPMTGGPARIVLNIGGLIDHKIELFDAAGRLWMEQTIPPTLSPRVSVDLDVSLYPSGGYIVRMMSDAGDDTEKFVIVK